MLVAKAIIVAIWKTPPCAVLLPSYEAKDRRLLFRSDAHERSKPRMEL
jgi:hypothetical protein